MILVGDGRVTEYQDAGFKVPMRSVVKRGGGPVRLDEKKRISEIIEDSVGGLLRFKTR